MIMGITEDKNNKTGLSNIEEIIFFEEDYNNKNISRLINWGNEKCEDCQGDCYDCSVMAVKQLIVYVDYLKKK